MKLLSPSAGRKNWLTTASLMLKPIKAPAAGPHLAALTASVGARLAGDVHPREKQPRESIWIALFKYLVHPEMTAASKGWQGRACL